MNILVTGGAGYIGSFVVDELIRSGYFPVVIDNLSTGFSESIPESVPLFNIDLLDSESLQLVFKKYKFEAVIHLAALAIVEDSVLFADLYLNHNYLTTKNLLGFCQDYRIKNFIFSSSGTVYGNQAYAGLLNEQVSPQPINPYGVSKLNCEKLVANFAQANQMQYLILRYFNVIGASKTCGQRAKRSTHLLHRLSQKAAQASSFEFEIYGNDYSTTDGTCVRDYINVQDIARIHLFGVDYLYQSKKLEQKILNCGYGFGLSVKEIVENFARANKLDISIKFAPRRLGDPDYLVADTSEISRTLAWRPQFQDFDQTYMTILQWHQFLLEHDAVQTKKIFNFKTQHQAKI